MRQIGKIKWFGGKNYLGEIQSYGFISQHQAPDMYLHKNRLLCNEDQLKENVVVTFDIGTHKNKEEAQKVRLISSEDDMETLQELSMHTVTWIWKSVFPYYINKLEKKDIYPFVLKKIQALTDTKERDFVLQFLDEEVFLAKYDQLARYVGSDQIKSRCISLYQSKEKAVSPELKEKFIGAITQTGLKEWNSIPLEVYRDNQDILMALSRYTETYFKCLLKLIEAYPELQESLLNRIYSILIKDSFYTDFLWSLIPVHLVKNEPIWSIAPKYIKFPLMDLENGTKENQEQLKKWLNEEKSFTAKREFVESLPAFFQKQRPFISFLPPKTQVELLWEEFQSSPDKVWRIFTKISKVLVLFRVAKEGVILKNELIVKLGQMEEELQIKALLLLLWGKSQNVEQKKSIFSKAHDYIQEDIINQAKITTEQVRTLRLLQGCYAGLVPYCEGRPWFTVEEKQEGKRKAERAYCPRRRGACNISNWSKGIPEDNYYVREYENAYEKKSKGDSFAERGEWAQIYSDPEFSWEQWSLHEFLEYCEITPVVAGLEDPNEYINKFAGWINRLNEIRERLKCSKCKQIMKNNFEYSKIFTAVYRTTIASCREGFQHDYNVYLSHCWGCESIIDSRESRIKVGHYYLCHVCGSGPQDMDYRPGDICPKCGAKDMINQGNRTYKCRNCNHTIKTSHRSI